MNFENLPWSRHYVALDAGRARRVTISPLHDAGWLGDLEETEERCRRYLEALRWPDGVSCPECDARPVTPIPAR